MTKFAARETICSVVKLNVSSGDGDETCFRIEA